MKYIITDKNEARVGGTFHSDMAEECEGKVVSAGHCRKNDKGKFEVWGKSIGYDMNAKSGDAELLDKLLVLNESD